MCSNLKTGWKAFFPLYLVFTSVFSNQVNHFYLINLPTSSTLKAAKCRSLSLFWGEPPILQGQLLPRIRSVKP